MNALPGPHDSSGHPPDSGPLEPAAYAAEPAPFGGLPLVVGLGEALVDRLPAGEVVGGAPLNVALHAAQLGNAAAMISRVGKDARGDRIVAYLRERHVETRGIGRDDALPTGTVDVVFGADGDPIYTITPDVAWDRLAPDPLAAELVGRAAAVCFGTLGQRAPEARATIAGLLVLARNATVLFDVNLRQAYFDRPLIEAGLQLAQAAKCNAHELDVLAAMFDLTGDRLAVAGRLAERFGLRWVAVTDGAQGTLVVADGKIHTSPPVAVDTSAGDPVGAGDSVSAALLHGTIRGWTWADTLYLANRVGAFVASQRGPCPPLPAELIALAGGKGRSR